MIVRKLESKQIGVPDYYQIYLRWLKRANDNQCNFAMIEAVRFARLAEEFGQAEITDDETEEV